MSQLEALVDRLDKHKLPHNVSELCDLFYRGAAHVVRSEKVRFMPPRRQVETGAEHPALHSSRTAASCDMSSCFRPESTPKPRWIWARRYGLGSQTPGLTLSRGWLRSYSKPGPPRSIGIKAFSAGPSSESRPYILVSRAWS